MLIFSKKKFLLMICSVLALILFSVTPSCNRRGQREDLLYNIPYNTSYFFRLNRFYQFQEGIIQQQKRLEEIIHHALHSPAIDTIVLNSDKNNFLSGLLLLFNHHNIRSILREDLILGIDKYNQPFIILSSYERDNSSLDNLYSDLKTFLSLHSNNEKRRSYSGIVIDMYFFDSGLVNSDYIDITSIYLSKADDVFFLSFSEECMIELILLRQGKSEKNITNNSTYIAFQKNDLFFKDPPLSIFDLKYTGPDLNATPRDHDSEISYGFFINGISSIIKSSVLSISRDNEVLSYKGYYEFSDDFASDFLSPLHKVRLDDYLILDHIPKETLSFSGFRLFSPSDLYYSLTAEGSFLSTDQIDSIKIFFETDFYNTGLVFKDDILDLIDGEFGFAFLDSFLGTEFAIIIRHKNKQSIIRTMESVFDYFSHLQPYSFEEEYIGHSFRVFPFGFLSPTVLITDELVILGSTRNVIRRIIDTMQKKTDSILSDKHFAKTINEKKINIKSNIISFSRNKRLLKNISPMINAIRNTEGEIKHIDLVHMIINYIDVFDYSTFEAVVLNNGCLIKGNWLKQTNP